MDQLVMSQRRTRGLGTYVERMPCDRNLVGMLDSPGRLAYLWTRWALSRSLGSNAGKVGPPPSARRLVRPLEYRAFSGRAVRRRVRASVSTARRLVLACGPWLAGGPKRLLSRAGRVALAGPGGRRKETLLACLKPHR
jgi:hypothetical protein